MRLSKWLVIGLLFLSPLALAKEPILSKEILSRYFAVAPAFEQVAQKHPSLSHDRTEGMMFKDDGQALADYLEKTPAYAELNEVANDNGFSAIGDVVNVASRLVAALYAVQVEVIPDMPTVEEQKAELEMQKEQLRAFGMTEEMVDQTLGEVEHAIAQQEQMAIEARTVPAEDKLVVKENLDWIVGNLEQFTAAE